MVFFFCMIIDIMNYEYFHYTCVVFVLPVVCSLELLVLMVCSCVSWALRPCAG